VRESIGYKCNVVNKLRETALNLRHDVLNFPVKENTYSSELTT